MVGGGRPQKYKLHCLYCACKMTHVYIIYRVETELRFILHYILNIILFKYNSNYIKNGHFKSSSLIKTASS